MDLITFVGFKSSGKTTAAHALLSYGYHSLSFADALKDALAAIFCWDRVLLEGLTDESREWREQVDLWWAEKLGIPDFTPRWAMMHIGTDVMRQRFHPDIWVYNVERRLQQSDGPVVIIDARFPNEIDLTHRYGGRVIRIKRGDDPWWFGIAIEANAGCDIARHRLEEIRVHRSEYAWIGSFVDDEIANNGSIADLCAQTIRLSQSPPRLRFLA